MLSLPQNGALRLTLLDELRDQAALVAQERERHDVLFVQKVRTLETRMHQCYQYLLELSKHLNIIRPKIDRIFDMGNGLCLDGLHVCEFFADSRKRMLMDRDHYDYIMFTFQYQSPHRLEVRKEFHQCEAFREMLISNNFVFEVEEIKNNRGRTVNRVFHITPLVAAALRIEAQYEDQAIRFKIKNIDRIGMTAHVFHVDQVNEALLEEMARCILAQSNTFRKLVSSAELVDGSPLVQQLKVRRS